MLSEIGNLLRDFEDVCDVFLKSGLRTCQCLLAAAAGPDVDLNKVVQELEKADIQVQSAFLDLIHGQKASMAGTTTFFSLFDMVQRLKIQPCMECCKRAVQESKLDGESITLSLLGFHKAAIMEELKALRMREQWTTKVTFTCDAKEDSESSCVEFPLHHVVLAAACQYLRGLWLGGFRVLKVNNFAAVRVESTDKHILQVMIDAAYGGEVYCASTVELLGLFFLADRWRFDLAASSALECIKGRLTSAEAEILLKQPLPPPPALLPSIAAVLNKSPPKSMPWGTATLFLQASSKVEIFAPQLLIVARQVVGRCLCDPSVEKVGLSQLTPQLLGLALPIEEEGTPKGLALLGSVLQWAAQFPAPADTSALPLAELSNLSALRDGVPKDTLQWLFLGAFCAVLRDQVFEEGQHELVARLLNIVFSEGVGASSASGSGRSEGEAQEREEEAEVLEVVEEETVLVEEVEGSPPASKRRRTQDLEEPQAVRAACLIEALRKCFQDRALASVSAFCSGPGLQALRSSAFIMLMRWLGEVDASVLPSIISAWVLSASTEEVFEALGIGRLSNEWGIAEGILGAARRRYSRVERLYLDAEGGKIEERIACDLAAAEAAQEKAFQVREAELRSQLEAALKGLAEEKKRNAQALAEAKSRYMAAVDQIFPSLAEDLS